MTKKYITLAELDLIVKMRGKAILSETDQKFPSSVAGKPAYLRCRMLTCPNCMKRFIPEYEQYAGGQLFECGICHETTVIEYLKNIIVR